MTYPPPPSRSQWAHVYASCPVLTLTTDGDSWGLGEEAASCHSVSTSLSSVGLAHVHSPGAEGSAGQLSPDQREQTHHRVVPFPRDPVSHALQRF